MNSPRVLIAASGSGGHLMPALQIAYAFKALAPESTIQFVGSGRPLESTIIDPSGFRRHEIKTVGLKRKGITGLIQFLKLLPTAIGQVKKIFREFSPDVVVGVGGYVSFLPIMYARMRGIPTWIHEAELKHGLANRVLAIFADKISVAFEEAVVAYPAKRVFTGHPIRQELVEVGKDSGTSNAPYKLLIMGGSQGARALDQTMPKLKDLIREKNLEIQHQSREDAVAEVTASYQAIAAQAQVVPYIKSIVDAYRWCDIIVSRSGAGAVMELGVINKPCILIPYPFAQGGHQLANAKTLEQKGKAIIVQEEADFRLKLEAALRQLLDPVQYAEMKRRPHENRSTNAAQRIAAGVIELISSKKRR